MAVPLSYNVRNVMNRPVATLTAAIGIALVVAIFIGGLALANGFRAVLVATGSPDNVIVLRKGADSEVVSAVERDAANVIRARPEIAQGNDGKPLVSPEVVVLINRERAGGGNANVTVRGIEPAAMALRDQVHLVRGRMFKGGADEVIVGSRIAGRLGDVDVGGQIRLGQQDFNIVGVFESGGSSFESEIWGDAAVLMPVFRGEVFQSVTLRLADPADFTSLERALENDPRTRVDVKRERDFYSAQSELLTTLIRFAGVFITLIMAVGAVFGAMNTMYASIGARTREIAVLLILGFSPRSIMLSFTLESVLLAVVGGIMGCLLALPINGITTGTTNFASFSEVAFAFRVTPGAMLAGMILALLIGLLGGILPARRAAKQPIAISLREL